jgi:hypothetical protein
VLSHSLWLACVILLIPTALGLVWFGPILTAVQHLVPPTMRATASAIFLFIINLIGLGLGTPLIGLVSDATRARFGVESLRYAILGGTGFYIAAALLLVASIRNLHRDWVE